MAKIVTISGSVSLPQEDGGAAAPYNLSTNFVYTQKAEFDLVFAAPVSAQAVPLGSLATGGAKLLLVKSSVGGCTFAANGESIQWPIAVGAYFLFINPTAAFITALTVTTTTAATISILALA
jgi:hypothetical protein